MVQEVTDKEIEQLLKSNDKVVVKYYAGWCGSCRLFKPKFNRLSNDERFADVAFLDIDAEHNPESRKLAGVDNLPFFAVFKNGTLLEGQATSKEESLVEMLNKL